MTRAVLTYIATAVVFLALDAGWLAVAGPRLYRPELGALLSDKVSIAPAAIFYVLYVFGLVWFCVLPSPSLGRAALAGAILGLVAYGAYDLTNAATLREWSTKVTIADLCWGAFASAVAATAGRAVASRIGG